MTQIKLENIPRMRAVLVHPIENPVNTATAYNKGYELTHDENGYGSRTDNPFMAWLDYQTAAADGDPVALNNLGCLYALNIAVDRDVDIASRIFAESEQMGCAVAAVNAGMMWEDEHDYEQAYLCYRRAYDLGDPIGRFQYAYLYEHGLYVQRDDSIAYQIYLQLAQEGYGDAYACVARMLMEGRGVDQDQESKSLTQEELNYRYAVAWYRCGVSCGDLDCIYELGKCYYEGYGIEQDVSKGMELLELAAARYDSRAIKYLESIDGKERPGRGLPIRQTETPKETGLKIALAEYRKNPCRQMRRDVIRALLEDRQKGEKGNRFYRRIYSTTNEMTGEEQWVDLSLPPISSSAINMRVIPICVGVAPRYSSQEYEQEFKDQYEDPHQFLVLAKGWQIQERALLSMENVEGIIINPLDDNCYLPMDLIKRMAYICNLQETSITT